MFFDAVCAMDDYADGYSVPVVLLCDEDGLTVIGYIIDIVIDPRLMFRYDDYVKGVICHEIIEFTTKLNVWQETQR